MGDRGRGLGAFILGVGWEVSGEFWILGLGFGEQLAWWGVGGGGVEEGGGGGSSECCFWGELLDAVGRAHSPLRLTLSVRTPWSSTVGRDRVGCFYLLRARRGVGGGMGWELSRIFRVPGSELGNSETGEGRWGVPAFSTQFLEINQAPTDRCLLVPFQQYYVTQI